MRSWRGWLAGVVVAAVVGGGAAIALAAPAPPSSDPFYTYSGPLQGIAPGTILRTRQIQVSEGGATTPYTGTQVLYRTTNQLGGPSATVATIIKPATAGVTQTKLLSYQTAYDGDSDTCRPSYQLEGGQPTNSIVEAETPLILNYVAQGFTVVTSDYEGPTDDYGAGRESGRNTLDAIRAAEHLLGLASASTPVGMLGYSGGSIATMWAAQEQPTYAPELHLNGVAAGGIPVDFLHNLAYIQGSSDWAGAIPSVGLGLLRAYRVNPNTYLSARGMQIMSQVAQGCLDPTAYPGLTFADLLKPQYQDWQHVPIFERVFDDSIMGRGATPKEPLLMGVGNADGTGDGVMVAKDVQQLAYEYCQRHVNVQFHVYSGDNHTEAVPQFEGEAAAFLQQVYNGQTPASGCASITPGNALTPLPHTGSTGPGHSAQPVALVLRVLGVRRRSHGLVVQLRARGGTLGRLVVELKRGRRIVARARIAHLGGRFRRVVLRVRRRSPGAGRYTVVALVGRRVTARRTVTVRRPRR